MKKIIIFISVTLIAIILGIVFRIIPNIFGLPLESKGITRLEQLTCTMEGKIIVETNSGGIEGFTECMTEYQSNRFEEEKEREAKKDCGRFGLDCNEAEPMKPVIYLYPPVEQEIQVRLQYQGEIFAHYPDYDEKIEGWKVIAKPDGTLINLSDNKEYSYLFWEGKPETPVDYDLSKGFVVKGSDTKAFLQQKLAEIGLTPKEYNEFIVYWFPKMQDNPYNLIHFAQEQYTDTAPLSTIPKSDSMLRVFMVFKKLEQPIQIELQTFVPFERNGLTVVEWGGGEIQ